MKNTLTKQIVVVSDVAAIDPNMKTEATAFFNPAGEPIVVSPAEAVAWGDITEVPTYVDAIADADNAGEARTAIGAAAATHTHIGDDVLLTGYVIDDSDADGWTGVVAATDNVTEAIAKLEARIAELEELADA